LERAHSLLQSECSDQKGILEQYEERFQQVKRHIESTNSDHANQMETVTRSNEELTKQIQKLSSQSKQADDEKHDLQQKLRDLEWSKDQDSKALQKQLEKARDDQEAYKINSF